MPATIPTCVDMGKQIGIVIRMTQQIGIPAVVVPALLSVVFVLCWSSGFLVAAVDVGAPVATILTWRFVVVVALLAGATAVLRRTRQHRAPRRADLGRHALVGLFSQVGYVVPIYVAVGLGVSTGTTALIDAVQPLVVATLVGPVLGLRVRGAQWAGLAAGAAGVALVVSADLGEGAASWWAYLLPLVAMASLVAATFVERRRPSSASVVDTLLLHATVALVAVGGFALLVGQAAPPTTAVFWGTVAFVAISPTLAAYGLYWYLVRRLGITVLNALLFCVAPTTAVAGALLFGEALTPLTVAGLALCATGVGVVIASEARGREAHGDQARGRGDGGDGSDETVLRSADGDEGLGSSTDDRAEGVRAPARGAGCEDVDRSEAPGRAARVLASHPRAT